MERVNYKRPHRAIVRCRAKMHLLQAAEHSVDWSEEIDDALLKELSGVLLQSHRYRTLFQQCQSKQDISHVEDQLIRELADTYQEISSRQQEPVVQRLNALL